MFSWDLFCINSYLSWYERELMKLNPDEQDKLLNKLFGEKNIVELTGEIMNYSAISNWLDPNKLFWEQDERIIKDVYWFRN